MNKIILYFNTVKYMKAGQLFARLSKLLPSPKQYGAYAGNFHSISVYLEGLDTDNNYLGRFHVDDLAHFKIDLLHECHELDIRSWEIKGDARHLWKFNLQYMEYLIPLAVAYQRSQNERYYAAVRQYILSWNACFVGKYAGDAWASYCLSLRVVNWLITWNILEKRIEQDAELKRELAKSIWLQYQYLAGHTEKHLLGNHYFENLKCLLICSVCFQDHNRMEKYKKELLQQLEEQILPDGMHFELSFMYHKIILEGLLRIFHALKSVNDAEYMKKLQQYIHKMSRVEASFELDIDRTLHFNDAGDNVAKPVCALVRAAEEICGRGSHAGKDVLENAGYYQFHFGTDSGSKIVIDCGIIGPDYIPGHGQCDCLSYELFVEGQSVISNSGTFQYQDEMRQYFRSTEAHNTFMINGVEQSCCWKEHRVANRITCVGSRTEGNTFIGKFTDQAGQTGERNYQINDFSIVITDQCINHRSREITSWLHISPDWTVTIINKSCVLLVDGNFAGKRVKVDILQGELDVAGVDGKKPFSREFGQLEYAAELRIKGNVVQYAVILEDSLG